MMYILTNPKTGSLALNKIFTSLVEIKKYREQALKVYGITTDYVVCRVTPVKV